MKYIGAHVSSAGGVENAPLNAQEIGANAFALFTKNQRQWHTPPLNSTSVSAFRENMKRAGINPRHVLPHDSYLINIANPDNDKRRKSLNALLDEARRVEELGLSLLNFHPGSCLKKISENESLDLIVKGVTEMCKQTKSVTMVLENTAGMGSSVGYSFEHLAYIIHNVEIPERVGVCLDTCHLFAAGYDLRTEVTFNETMMRFDAIVGFSYLRGMHLNDSKTCFSSNVDRHMSLGKGEIGLTPFRKIMADSRFDDMPLILETTDKKLWKEEIKLLRDFEQD